MSLGLGVTPYPLLSPDTDDFLNSTFDCEISLEPFDPASVTVTLHYSFATNGRPELEYFENLCEEGLAERVVLVESPESLHRSVERVSREGYLTRADGVLFGRVRVTPLLVSTAEIPAYLPPNLHPEWASHSARILHGDILAIGETLRFEVSHKLSRRRPMIDLQVSEQVDQRVYRVDPTGDVIVVLAGPDVRRAIEIMSKDPSYKPALFMSLYKDVLQEGLRHAREHGGEQAWLRSLERHLDIDDIENLTDEELWEAPQKLLFDLGAKKVLVNSENG